MKRRHFIFTSAAFAGMATSPVLSSCKSSIDAKTAKGAESYPDMPEYTLTELGEHFRKTDLSPKILVEKYLERIEALDKGGPGLHSIIELNPDALADAEKISFEIASGVNKGPLHGIPVLLKDNIDTADKMHTSAGSLALKDSFAKEDAFLVKRLRAAGAVILGKTNLSEWANIRSNHSTSGWSGRGGQTHNPYYIDRNPCGSSSGSGVAVSANLCAIAIGTETDGSIVCPSSTNGIVGIKPTVGLWSRSGIIPISFTQDTAGPMARTVADAAALLGICIGTDTLDPITGDCPFKPGYDFTKSLDALGLKGARIGVDRNSFGFSQAVDKIMEDAIYAMKSAGAIIIDPASLSIPREAGDMEMEILMVEFKYGINKYLEKCSDQVKVRNLQDLIRYNEEHKAEEMPWFGQENFLVAQSKGDLTDPVYQKALADSLRLNRAEGLDKVLNTNNLDAIIAPTGGPAWMTDWINGDHFSGGSSSPAACAGYPAITVPAGNIHGLPIGITFMGRAWSEETLIKLAFAFEQMTHARISPTFKATFAG